MQSPRSMRRALVTAGVFAALAAATAALAQIPQGPATPANGVYRGEITTGPNAGQPLVITVFAMRPDRISLKANRPTVRDQEVDVKVDGDHLVNVEVDGRVKFNLKTTPIELEYKPNPETTFVGKKL